MSEMLLVPLTTIAVRPKLSDTAKFARNPCVPERLQEVIQRTTGVVKVLPALGNLSAEDGAELPEVQSDGVGRLPGDVRLREVFKPERAVVAEELDYRRSKPQACGRAKFAGIVAGVQPKKESAKPLP